jgi:hypothetical protein
VTRKVVRVDELVGAAEIAERLTKSGHTSIVHDWRHRYPRGSKNAFPEPLAELKAGLVWAWPDVEAWARRTKRLPN